ncbi:MAG: hypothetical protein ACOX3S_13705 [Anaerolineae bacterium]
MKAEYNGRMQELLWGDERLEAADRDPSVLVAVVPRPSDWAHIVDQGWYHLPVARAPRRIAADYIAFYLPACFGANGHAVRYYAEVRGYDLLTRLALFPDEPEHPRAQAAYYCLRLGPVQELPWPVPAARLRRITFIRTTWQRLLQAGDVTDLWLHEPRNARLAELRESRRPYLCLATAAASL